MSLVWKKTKRMMIKKNNYREKKRLTTMSDWPVLRNVLHMYRENEERRKRDTMRRLSSAWRWLELIGVAPGPWTLGLQEPQIGTAILHITIIIQRSILFYIHCLRVLNNNGYHPVVTIHNLRISFYYSSSTWISLAKSKIFKTYVVYFTSHRKVFSSAWPVCGQNY